MNRTQRKELVSLAIKNAEKSSATTSVDATHAYAAVVHAIAHLLQAT